MYTQFFGITAKPFDLLPNPRFLYLSKGHKKALSYLQYGLQECAGFTLLTGEVGSGKTTLLRDIVNKAKKKHTLAMIFNTKVDGLQLLAMVNEEFGLCVDGRDKVALLRELNDFLLAEYSANRHPILIIDEAQNLSAEALEEVRLLSNLEDDNFKLMQIILVGQPELKDVIARPELRQLRQRISVSCHLSPLNRDEMEEYIYHRLAMVGNRDAVTFQTEVLDLVFSFSQGVPRLINLICDSLLLSAFVEETREIKVDLANEVVEELTMIEASAGGMNATHASEGQGDFLTRLDKVETNCNNLNTAQAEREAMLDRLASQGNILEYLINLQQKQFTHYEESLNEISGQIDRLRQLILSRTGQEVVSLDSRKKN